MKLRSLIVFAAVCLTMSSCVTPRKTHYLQRPGDFVASYPQVHTPADYKIRISDELNITVYTLDEESKALFSQGSGSGGSGGGGGTKGLYSYTVYEDGAIDFPYIGTIPVAGKTTREVKYEIEELLKAYIKDCSVSVKLANCYFSFITNEEASRVQIPKEKLTIFEALALAGDLDEYDDRKHVQLIRQDAEGNTQIKQFDLRSRDILGSEYYYVQPNDIIYVKRFKGQFFRIRKFLTIFGITTSTVSFGLLIYQVVRLCMGQR